MYLGMGKVGCLSAQQGRKHEGDAPAMPREGSVGSNPEDPSMGVCLHGGQWVGMSAGGVMPSVYANAV